jgi:prolyl-tRNA synthetase
MKMSNSFFITRKEFPNDEEVDSAKLLIKSGMILKVDNGIYSYLPIGLRVLNNIKKIIREEMECYNADEVLTPSLVKSEIFDNRNESFNNEMFKIKDRNDNNYSLCPTHEELFAMMARNKIESYKDLHFCLYQISNKFRDEIKTKYGLIRKKEFTMFDAYSFDADDSGLDISYDKMYQSFTKIFKKLDIDVINSNADAEDMNGVVSEEFHTLCEYGESRIVKCKRCSYCMNIESASSYDTYKKERYDTKKIQEVYTPNVTNIKSLKEYLQIPSKNIIKSLIYRINGEYTMILLRADAELNIEKLSKILNTKDIIMPSSTELESIGTHVGFIGPYRATMKIIADNEIKSMTNVVCGSNKIDYHYMNVNPGIDFKVDKYADIKIFNENSLCPRCKCKANISNSIEVGHIFKLGTNYSEKYHLKYLDETNELNLVQMGSYGIGLDRCIGAIVEKHHDIKGIVWPMAVAPFKVAIVIANVNDKETFKYANNLYTKLNRIGIDTILDDRKETIGIKFNDIDLIGIPIRVTVGYKLNENKVELKIRNEEDVIDIDTSKIIDEIIKKIE